MHQWHDDVIKWKLFSALLALRAGNSPVTGEYPSQRPVTRSFDVFFDQLLYKQLSKQSSFWWFETPSRPLSRHCNGFDNQNDGIFPKMHLNVSYAVYHVFTPEVLWSRAPEISWPWIFISSTEYTLGVLHWKRLWLDSNVLKCVSQAFSKCVFLRGIFQTFNCL